MKAFLAVTALVAVVATRAIAADMPVKAPAAVSPAKTWSGCYLGVGGGYGMSNLDYDVIEDITGILRRSTATTGGRGSFATGGVGCDYQAGRWVIGGFADADWSHIKGQHNPLTFSIFGVTGSVGEMRQDWAWAVGPRVGYLVTPTLLTYVAGGYAATRFDQVNYVLSDRVGLIGTSPGIILPAQQYSGFFVGGGIEYNLWSGFFIKTEYRFADYGRKTIRQVCTDPALCFPNNTLLERIHPYVQTIRTELVWKFNWGR